MEKRRTLGGGVCKLSLRFWVLALAVFGIGTRFREEESQELIDTE